MDLNQFDYSLPEHLIAQIPLAERTASRLLVVPNDDSELNHRQFSDITDSLHPGDLLVLNNTKVIPARLLGRKPTGGAIEIMIERVLDDYSVLAHVRASKAPKPGSVLIVDEQFIFTVTAREGDLFHLQSDDLLDTILNEAGQLPLPPYIERQVTAEDSDRYQTVFAHEKGAVAAPTAGLHFDQALLDTIASKGIDIATITLHVGAGTFQPVRVENIREHKLHAERIKLSLEVCGKILQTKQNGGRVIAVGTTCARTLESAAQFANEQLIEPFEGETDLFIMPGFNFKIVDAMVTNFHLPKSTLMMLVSAFAGHEKIMRAYQEAVSQAYRFFSYGDAMFLERG